MEREERKRSSRGSRVRKGIREVGRGRAKSGGKEESKKDDVQNLNRAKRER